MVFLVRSTKDDTNLHRNESFKEAKAEADFRCNLSHRTVHFRVVEEKDVYITSYLDEAMKGL